MTPATFIAQAAEWRKLAKRLRDEYCVNEAKRLEQAADELERLCAAWRELVFIGSVVVAKNGVVTYLHGDIIGSLPAGQPKEERK